MLVLKHADCHPPSAWWHMKDDLKRTGPGSTRSICTRLLLSSRSFSFKHTFATGRWFPDILVVWSRPLPGLSPRRRFRKR